MSSCAVKAVLKLHRLLAARSTLDANAGVAGSLTSNANIVLLPLGQNHGHAIGLAALPTGPPIGPRRHHHQSAAPPTHTSMPALGQSGCNSPPKNIPSSFVSTRPTTESCGRSLRSITLIIRGVSLEFVSI